jgi:hypothetical protein
MRAVIFAAAFGLGVAHAQPTPEPTTPPTAPPTAPTAPTAPTDPANPKDAQPAEPSAPPADAPAQPAQSEPAAAASEPAPTSDVPRTPEPATPLPAAPDAVTPSRNKDIAWLFVGGALTFVTAGAVLAYSTASAESDIKDLYVTTGRLPPQFDAETQERYDDLVAEGERYQLLSRISFGLAGACALGAGYFFWRASQEKDVTVAPVVTPTSAGVSVRF